MSHINLHVLLSNHQATICSSHVKCSSVGAVIPACLSYQKWYAKSLVLYQFSTSKNWRWFLKMLQRWNHKLQKKHIKLKTDAWFYIFTSHLLEMRDDSYLFKALWHQNQDFMANLCSSEALMLKKLAKACELLGARLRWPSGTFEGNASACVFHCFRRLGSVKRCRYPHASQAENVDVFEPFQTRRSDSKREVSAFCQPKTHPNTTKKRWFLRAPSKRHGSSWYFLIGFLRGGGDSPNLP